LYIVALLPVASAVASIVAGPSLDVARPFLAALAVTTGAMMVAVAFFALLYNHRRPSDRRARAQVRWVLIALSVPVAGTVFFIAGQYVGALASGARAGGVFGSEDQVIHGAISTAWLGPLWLFTPLAIGYALLAHKLFDIQLLFQRTLRYSLLTGVVAVVYVLLAGGMSWAIYGSLGKPSTVVLVVATLFTAMILAPARTRLERVIDRSFMRDQFDFKETLEGFARGLPNIAERRTLATVTGRVVRAAMKTQTFCLFTLDRKTGKLRYEKNEQESASRRQKESSPQGGVEFDPAEPLCRYLVERNRPFEVEVSPYDARLIPIFQGASDRLSKIRAAIIFGLVRNRELVGLMTLGDKITDEFYNAEDIRLLQMVARQAAVVIEKTEVFEAVAQVEELIENQPSEGPLESPYSPAAPPVTIGCDLAGQTASAQPAGGDYYDFVEIPGQKLGLSIGNVSGRGDSAAALKASLQTQLRSLAGSEKNLSVMVRRINRQLFASFRGAKYCSFFYAVYEPGVHRLEFVNAGHNPPLVVGPKGVRSLVSTGVPLGLFGEATHDARFESLEPGSLLILFSDGVTSARDRTGESFGLDRLVSSVTRSRGLDAASVAERILGDIREFTDRLPLEEDRTIIILKVAEGSTIPSEKS
ncbi:MAG: SpoIIE family protein phosphatase, partial [Deltaproteobacteria bacterium]